MENYKDFMAHQLKKMYHNYRLDGMGEHESLNRACQVWILNNQALPDHLGTKTDRAITEVSEYDVDPEMLQINLENV